MIDFGTQATIGMLGLFLPITIGLMVIVAIPLGIAQLVSNKKKSVKPNSVVRKNGFLEEFPSVAETENLDLLNISTISNVLLKDNTGKIHHIDQVIVSPSGVYVVAYIEAEGLLSGSESDRCWSYSLNGKETSVANPVGNLLGVTGLLSTIFRGVKLKPFIICVGSPVIRVQLTSSEIMSWQDFTKYLTSQPKIYRPKEVNWLNSTLYRHTLRGSKNIKDYQEQVEGKV